MPCSSTDSEVKYPNCRCVDITKPLCFFCEDTEVEEEEEESDEKKTDNNLIDS